MQVTVAFSPGSATRTKTSAATISTDGCAFMTWIVLPSPVTLASSARATSGKRTREDTEQHSCAHGSRPARANGGQHRPPKFGVHRSKYIT